MKHYELKYPGIEFDPPLVVRDGDKLVFTVRCSPEYIKVTSFLLVPAEEDEE